MSSEFKQQECVRTYEFTRPHLQQHRTALDIGCDEFMFAGLLTQDFDHVHCWDFRDKSAQMSRHVANAEQVTFHHTGLGEQTAVRYTKPGVGRVKGNVKPEGRSTLSVPIRTLDSFELPATIDFVKMDVEGYEPRILQGAEKTIKASWPMVLCEINRGDFTAQKILESWGYRLVDVYHKQGTPHDYLFVKG